MKWCKYLKQMVESGSKNMSGLRLTTAGWVVAVMLSSSQAHDQVPGAPQTRPIVIRNATIHVVDGAVITNGDVLFVAGKITSIG